MDQTQRCNYVLAYPSDYSEVDYSGGYMTEFMVKGKSVCREVWLLIHSMNKEWGNCEELPKKPFGRLSVNCRPTVDRQSTDS